MSVLLKWLIDNLSTQTSCDIRSIRLPFLFRTKNNFRGIKLTYPLRHIPWSQLLSISSFSHVTSHLYFNREGWKGWRIENFIWYQKASEDIIKTDWDFEQLTTTDKWINHKEQNRAIDLYIRNFSLFLSPSLQREGHLTCCGESFCDCYWNANFLYQLYICYHWLLDMIIWNKPRFLTIRRISPDIPRHNLVL